MLAPGTRLGPYEILSPLGAGGMGEVYRAVDERLKREVAVKVLSRFGSHDPERLTRFEQEARAASALSHPNILTIFDVGENEGVPFVVSELLEGETLRERLARGPLPPRKVVDLARELARGLAAAHEAGIVHRDLKPENVFLTRDGRLKILDFGLAKIVSTSGSQKAAPEATTMAALTDSGFVVGTAGYMSPEQVRSLPVDHRSDIFSFGSILYEMLTGRRAFQGASAVETMNAVLTADPPELAGVSTVTPPGLERILRHCLEKERNDRFQSTRDLAFDLDALSSISSAALPVPAARVAPRRRLLLLAVVGVLAAAVAAGAVWLLRSVRTVEPARYHQLTFRRGTILTARFAKDGESVVYGAAWDGEPFRVFSMRAGSPESAAAALPNADVLSISASEELALALNRRFAFGWITSGTLARAPFTGGAPRELLERVQEADWAPDGSLAIVRRVEGRTRLECPQGRVLFETPSWVSHPRVSPDGSRIAFLDHPVYADDHGAVTIVRAGEAPRRLTLVYASAQGICWTPDGREIWFSASEKGANTALMAVTPAGRVRTVARAPGRLRLLDISRAGRVLVTRESSVASVFVRGPERARGTRSLVARPLHRRGSFGRRHETAPQRGRGRGRRFVERLFPRDRRRPGRATWRWDRYGALRRREMGGRHRFRLTAPALAPSHRTRRAEARPPRADGAVPLGAPPSRRPARGDLGEREGWRRPALRPGDHRRDGAADHAGRNGLPPAPVAGWQVRPVCRLGRAGEPLPDRRRRTTASSRRRTRG